MADDVQETTESEFYRLYYWPSLQGRGEFVRLVLEDSGVPYLDVARLPPEAGGGVERILEILCGEHKGLLPYAPPLLRAGSRVISQTSLICDFLARRVGLVREEEKSRASALQLQLTIMDVASEVHDTHHPVSVGQYYEDQTAEAVVAAKAFVSDRLPKWLAYFERLIERDGPWLLGAEVSYVDLSLFQLVSGLRYAFPKAMAKAAAEKVFDLTERVRKRPAIAHYLESDRRLPFNEHGIFRYYEALDFEG